MGVVHTQCSHVFICSSVDLQLGERWVYHEFWTSSAETYHRFANTDYSFLHAFRQRINVTKEAHLPYTLSYDCNCVYSVNLMECMEQMLNMGTINEAELDAIVKVIDDMIVIILMLHVQGNKEDCMYKFWAAYVEFLTHFFSETAEYYWPEANQLASAMRQMNNGHLQDTLIDHHSDWNYKKMITICRSYAMIVWNLYWHPWSETVTQGCDQG